MAADDDDSEEELVALGVSVGLESGGGVFSSLRSCFGVWISLIWGDVGNFQMSVMGGCKKVHVMRRLED